MHNQMHMDEKEETDISSLNFLMLGLHSVKGKCFNEIYQENVKWK